MDPMYRSLQILVVFAVAALLLTSLVQAQNRSGILSELPGSHPKTLYCPEFLTTAYRDDIGIFAEKDATS
jgi:hypothetical protein